MKLIAVFIAALCSAWPCAADLRLSGGQHFATVQYEHGKQPPGGGVSGVLVVLQDCKSLHSDLQNTIVMSDFAMCALEEIVAALEDKGVSGIVLNEGYAGEAGYSGAKFFHGKRSTNVPVQLIDASAYDTLTKIINAAGTNQITAILSTAPRSSWVVFGQSTEFQALLYVYVTAHAVLILWCSWKLVAFIRRLGLSTSLAQLALIFTNISLVFRIFVFLSDRFSFGTEFPESTATYWRTLPAAFLLLTSALFVFFWLELQQNTSLRRVAGLSRFKVPFLVLIFAVIILDVTLSVLRSQFLVSWRTGTVITGAAYVLATVAIGGFSLRTGKRLLAMLAPAAKSAGGPFATLSTIKSYFSRRLQSDEDTVESSWAKRTQDSSSGERDEKSRTKQQASALTRLVVVGSGLMFCQGAGLLMSVLPVYYTPSGRAFFWGFAYFIAMLISTVHIAALQPPSLPR